MLDTLLWETRAFIYAQFVETARAPSLQTTAQHFHVTQEQAGVLYTELAERHAIFLEPGSLDIRMANPFSAVPTGFRVQIGRREYFANCAWDMLGIPAALAIRSDLFCLNEGLSAMPASASSLHRHAHIQAYCAESGQPLELEVRDGQVHPANLPIHFPLPFSRWYEDLAHT
jgi:hypothetical protein